jgi:23S rRNA pseudouridine1911/1915/1917 synthase
VPDISDKADSSVGGSVRRVRAQDEHAGRRLDWFLAASVPDLSRSRLQALLAGGAVSRGDQMIRDGNTRVKPGQIYEIAVPEPVPAIPRAQAIPLVVVHEDSDLIVIDKPAGLVVHPAVGNPDGTLVNALIAHCGASLAGVGGVARPGIVHRLDKNTSGLLVAAKNDRAMASLARQFAARTIERAYHAATWGAPRAGEGVIEGDIGRNPFDRKRMAIVRNQGKPARTRYRMLERYGNEARPFASLIECRLETGRTHQIRVHLAHFGHPLIGDSVYGRARRPPRAKTEAETRAQLAAAEFPRQALHAWLLGFQHPSTHNHMRFEAPWPKDFTNLINALRGIEK